MRQVQRAQRAQRQEAHFDPSVEQAVMARRFASRVVADAGLTSAVHDVALAAGELATNAAEHAGTPFDVAVVLDRCVHIEVIDGSTALPVIADIDVHAERGRGMALVDLVSTRWGVEPTPTGKRVWFEIDYF